MTTPKPPMLLPPVLVPSDPIHVSTFAKPEYADLTFTYGKVKSGGNWPVHCKSFTVSIPTGRQATALTSEPSLIHYELTVPTGRRAWTVEADTRDPDKVVFTCSPPPDEPAAFDGTWSVELKLWGIEVNGGVGKVDITWEESTSTTGEDGPYQERAGTGTVSKSDDSFYLHSFRPATVAIKRGTKPTLHWNGTAQAKYTMYYRKPDGTQGSATASGDSWTSPVDLVDDSSFILQAEMGNEVRYLTTSIKVNDPDIAVTSVAAPTATGSISIKNNIVTTGDLTLGPNKTLDVDHINARTANGAIKVGNDLTIATSKALKVDTVQATTVTGTISVKNGLTLATGKTLTANGPILAQNDLTVSASHTFRANYINSTNGDAITVRDNLTLATGKMLTANGGLTSIGTTTAKGNLKVESTEPGNGILFVKHIISVNGNESEAVEFFSPISGNPRDAGAPLTVARTLIAGGPVNIAAGQTLTANGPAVFAGRIDGLFPASTVARWSGTSYSVAVDADMIATVRNEHGKKQFINVWSGGNMLFEIGLDAWEVATVPLRKGWTFQKRSPDGGNLDVWRFYLGAKP
ncbi:hypothetical protein ACWGKU_06295 [Kitasatospora sp. NPDC054768]